MQIWGDTVVLLHVIHHKDGEIPSVIEQEKHSHR